MRNDDLRDESAGLLAFFAAHESEVRSYCRRIPSLLRTAKGACIVDDQGRTYVDFLSVAAL